MKNTITSLSIPSQFVELYHSLIGVGYKQVLTFDTQLSAICIANIYLYLKQSKQYKGLPYKDANGHDKRIETLAEYCEVFLKKSVTRVRDLVQNYDLLGAELYEQAEQLGLTAKDYQAFKRLTNTKQQLVKQAILRQDKKQVMTILYSRTEG